MYKTGKWIIGFATLATAVLVLMYVYAVHMSGHPADKMVAGIYLRFGVFLMPPIYAIGFIVFYVGKFNRDHTVQTTQQDERE